MPVRLHVGLLVTSLFTVACSPPTAPGTQPSPSGPPAIDYDLVRQHAQQFDVDVPNRPAGSQHELAAATYILGHLQFAGFAPVLDAVPVANQVQSTNVVALPPNGDEPEIVLAVGYDDDGRGPGEGAHIGLFLELARAVNVAAPDHRVAFVALGAEEADHAGSARLARTLAEYGVEPQLLLFTGPTSVAGGALGACLMDQRGGELVEDVADCVDAFGYSWLQDVIAGQTNIGGTGPRIAEPLLRLLRSTAH